MHKTLKKVKMNDNNNINNNNNNNNKKNENEEKLNDSIHMGRQCDLPVQPEIGISPP